MLHGLVFASVGLFLLGSAIVAVVRDPLAARSWRQTQCTILKVQIGNGAWGRHHTPVYDQVIQYRYSVNGQEFTSSAVDFRSHWGVHTSTDRDYAQFASRFQVGQSTGCYYDPQHPDRAVLTIETSAGSYLGAFVLGITFSVVGMGVMRLGWRGPAQSSVTTTTPPWKPDLLPKIDPDELRVQATAEGTLFRFPSRRIALKHSLPGLVVGALLVIIGPVIAATLLPRMAVGMQHAFSGSARQVTGVWLPILVACAFILLGLYAMAGGVFVMLGHTEILISRAGIRTRERVGPFWLGASVPIEATNELVVLAPPKIWAVTGTTHCSFRIHQFAANLYINAGLAVLVARGAPSGGLILAQGYPPQVMHAWANRIAECINRVSSHPVGIGEPFGPRSDAGKNRPIPPRDQPARKAPVIE